MTVGLEVDSDVVLLRGVVEVFDAGGDAGDGDTLRVGQTRVNLRARRGKKRRKEERGRGVRTRTSVRYLVEAPLA